MTNGRKPQINLKNYPEGHAEELTARFSEDKWADHMISVTNKRLKVVPPAKGRYNLNRDRGEGGGKNLS